MKKTIKKADLVNAIHKAIGLSITETNNIVGDIFDEIAEAAAKGEKVKLPSFATFYVRDKKVREGRNPKTGESALIFPRRVLMFKASCMLIDSIDKQLLKR
ncbi:integration host factor subunit alpha [Bartonella sp. DGB1]|uniref:integration host factor subunit alpha n=1 Tax=Bartonella sp. DGB1 TaxID=3239807 RepID=UPI0035268898